jgi:hypothetical protein
VVLLEPKGDLIEDVLRRLPQARLDDVVLIDPVADRDHPVGLNLLAPAAGQDRGGVTEAIMAVLRDLFAGSWGPRTDDVLYNGIYTAASRPDATLADLPRLYADAAFRRPFLASLDDPLIADFWRWFGGLTPGERGAILAPALNKLRALLRPGLATIVGQPRSTVDLARVLAERRLLFVRLPRDGALFGALVVARIWQAAQARLAVPPGRRPDVVLAVDEVESFLRTGGDLGDMLAVARGLNLGLVLATQHLDQCPPALRTALLANARSRLIFQADAHDAAVLARSFAGALEAVDLMGLGRFEVAGRVAVEGEISAPFTGRTVPLPESVRDTTVSIREESRRRYGRRRADVEAELRARLAPSPGGDLSDVPIGTFDVEDDDG